MGVEDHPGDRRLDVQIVGDAPARLAQRDQLVLKLEDVVEDGLGHGQAAFCHAA